MASGRIGICENTGAFHNQINTQITPAAVLGRSFTEIGDTLVIDLNETVTGCYGLAQTAMC